MTKFRDGYLIVLLISFLFSFYVSCSGTGQSYLYKGPILNTESIALPDCKPAKGVTKIKTTTWLHPELAEGQDFLFETTALVNWETTKDGDMLKVEIKMYQDSKQNRKSVFEDSKLFLPDFSCNLSKDGNIDNIVHTKRGETPAAQLANDLAIRNSFTKEYLTELVHAIIPQFQVKNFRPGDAAATIN